MDGKVALITGGASGAGKAIARKLAARGARVIIQFQDSPDDAECTRAEIAATGAAVETVRASVACADDVRRLFTQIEERCGRLDILINAAPAGTPAEDSLGRTFDTDLKGAFWCARHASVVMARHGGGVIVNVSHVGASLASAQYSAMGASKAGFEALTRYLAAECAPLNIRVNAASAALIDAAAMRHHPRLTQMHAQIVPSVLLRRPPEPDDLADVVLFLTSDQSRWIAGQTLLADGGLSLGPSECAAFAQSMAAGPMPSAIAALAKGQIEDASPEVHSQPEIDTEDIAIVGIGIAVPGAMSCEQFWDNLVRGPDLFENVPVQRWHAQSFYAADGGAADKAYSQRGGFVKDSDADHREDNSVRWLRHSLAQAMGNVRRREADRFCLVVGYSADGNQQLEKTQVARGLAHRLRNALDTVDGEASDKAQLAGRIEERLRTHYSADADTAAALSPDAAGRSAMCGLLPDDTDVMMIDSACSSSLYALDSGMKGLLAGKFDIAVCGGAFGLGPLHHVLSSKLGVLSRSGSVRAFDQSGDGVVFSDGAGVVALKRLHRAQRDGDRILGVIKAFGASANGKGKAIHAPALNGQRLALTRAQAHPAYRTPDWVLAHATGTPIVDRTEVAALGSRPRSDRKLYLTSNKSVIGHTNHASGIVSLIQAVLAFQHNVIPPQHRFNAPPADAPLSQAGVEIPCAPQAWVRDGEPRHAAVSAFGFGGANAHLLLGEPDPRLVPAPRPQRPYAERIALIAWAADVPGLREPAEIERWLRGERAAPPVSFGAQYPTAGLERLRMTPRTVRSLDRTQLMALACAQALRQRIPALWDEKRATAGVFLGQMGRTHQSILHGHRVYLDDVYRALANDGNIAGSPLFEPSFEKLRVDLDRAVSAANEDSLAGSMPNVIAGRVASVFDLQGMALSCDAGFASSLAAFELGMRYLKSGDLDLAIVGGVNGNSEWEAADTLRRLGLREDVIPAEGAFMFALTRESIARERDIPVLAYVYSAPRGGNTTTVPAFDSGLTSINDRSPFNYMGAEGALAVLRALHGDTEVAIVRCRNGSIYDDRCLRTERPSWPTVASTNAATDSELIGVSDPAPGSQGRGRTLSVAWSGAASIRAAVGE
jgi:3-oxoacyl-(acyl-carrier-protein) synthase/NAD(P)-dependent dehydrogenase (short-subunit alcohol dehydrogenase family)